MESIFEGQIKTTPPQSTFNGDSITWFDIVEFAKSKPNEFTLTNTPTGTRSCQFSLKGVQVEISKDDWKIIMSGALDGFILAPRQAFEEDEVAELATLRDVKERLGVLIKSADKVAEDARQLGDQLMVREKAITDRRSLQVASGLGFQLANQFRSQANRDYDLYADLPRPSGHRSSSASSVPPTPSALAMAEIPPTIMPQQPLWPGSRPSGVDSAVRDSDEENRALVTPKIEKLESGTPIQPPCDRCRRLKISCIKNRTACQGCTKKHGKCGWKALTKEEMARLKDEASRECGGDGDESRAFGSASQTGPYDPVRIRSWPTETTRV
ncbi:hypothetical protein DL771_010833 [Monosporascus sp. 5C6A]|nr:hypothetical protein DL771_010833 [Monosporascus sp. 5C6A]